MFWRITIELTGAWPLRTGRARKPRDRRVKRPVERLVSWHGGRLSEAPRMGRDSGEESQVCTQPCTHSECCRSAPLTYETTDCGAWTSSRGQTRHPATT